MSEASSALLRSLLSSSPGALLQTWEALTAASAAASSLAFGASTILVVSALFCTLILGPSGAPMPGSFSIVPVGSSSSLALNPSSSAALSRMWIRTCPAVFISLSFPVHTRFLTCLMEPRSLAPPVEGPACCSVWLSRIRRAITLLFSSNVRRAESGRAAREKHDVVTRRAMGEQATRAADRDSPSWPDPSRPSSVWCSLTLPTKTVNAH